MSKRWLSVDEFGEHLGVNPGTIYRWITRKRMPSHKAGTLWELMASEVDEWVRIGKAGKKGGRG